MSQTCMYLDFNTPVNKGNSKQLSELVIEFLHCYTGWEFALIYNKSIFDTWKKDISANGIKHFAKHTNSCFSQIFSEEFDDNSIALKKLENPYNRYAVITMDINASNRIVNIGNNSVPIEYVYMDCKAVYDWLVQRGGNYSKKIVDQNGKTINGVDFEKLNIRPLREYAPNLEKHGEFGNKKAGWDNIRKEYVSALYCSRWEARDLFRFALGKFNNYLAYDENHKKFMAYYAQDPGNKTSEPFINHSFHIEDIYNPDFAKKIERVDKLVKALVTVGQAPIEYKNYSPSKKN